MEETKSVDHFEFSIIIKTKQLKYSSHRSFGMANHVEDVFLITSFEIFWFRTLMVQLHNDVKAGLVKFSRDCA